MDISTAALTKLEDALREVVQSIPDDQLKCPPMVTPAMFNAGTVERKRFIIVHEAMHAIIGVLNPRR